MNDAVESVIASHGDRVQAWLANQPGAWGFLAGQAVLGERRRLGRSLTEQERRLVWQALWNRLLLEKARVAGGDG
ncbi:MAG: hypothetical protein HYX51_05395 [Chloroflexi bacterium]|nr:hypothetical protein [Chloroflexota bacterium]